MPRIKVPLNEVQKEQIREIYERLDRLGIPEATRYAYLAREIGLPNARQNVRNWMTGERTPEDPGIFGRMLDALQKGPIVDRPRQAAAFPPLKLPYAGVVPCGDWGDPLESEEMVDVDAKFHYAKGFITTVVGDSCYPALRPGDTTIWVTDLNPREGRIVLAQRKGDHGCTVKELAWDPARQRFALKPINPSYAEPEDGEGWGVIARLVGVIRVVDGIERTWRQLEGLTPGNLM